MRSPGLRTRVLRRCGGQRNARRDGELRRQVFERADDAWFVEQRAHRPVSRFLSWGPAAAAGALAGALVAEWYAIRRTSGATASRHPKTCWRQPAALTGTPQRPPPGPRPGRVSVLRPVAGRRWAYRPGRAVASRARAHAGTTVIRVAQARDYRAMSPPAGWLADRCAAGRPTSPPRAVARPHSTKEDPTMRKLVLAVVVTAALGLLAGPARTPGCRQRRQGVRSVRHPLTRRVGRILRWRRPWSLRAAL